MLQTIRKIYDFAQGYQGLLKKSLCFAFLNGIFAALQFYALYIVLEALVQQDQDIKIVWLSLLVMVVSILGRMIASYFSMNQQTEVGYGMVAKKRIAIGNRLRYIPMGYFNKNNIGKITGVVTTTLQDVENGAPIALVSIVGGIMNTFVLILCLCIVHLQLGLLAAIGMIGYLFITELATSKSTKNAKNRQKGQYKLVESILEYIQGIQEVKAFGCEDEQLSSVTNAITKSADENIGLVNKVSPYLTIQQLLIRLVNVAMLALTLYLFVNEELSFVTSVFFVILSFMIFNGLETAGSQITMLQMLAASIDEANAIDKTPLMDECGSKQTLNNHDIIFKDVSFAYDQRMVLEHINLTIKEHTTTAIVGPSGSGKTTICNLISRFWDVSSGSISIGGIDVKDFTLDSLMENISMVFQNVYLFADTIEHNIAFGCKDATHEEVVAAAKKAHCHEFIMSLKDGYDTVLVEGGNTLSAGQCQRISIARAMLKDAPIVILDEITSSLDPENENLIVDALETLTHQKTVIMIAHRLKTVRNADQILVLDEGKLVQQGNHEQLMKEKGIYSAFINIRKQATEWKI